jgi:hypothetical protein
MVRLRSNGARDRLISLVRYGKVTPQAAEAEAAARGWPPFERMPAVGTLDPMEETRWPIVMAVAWIAWRDIELTQEQSAEFQSECTHWIFREWNQPIKNGTAFARRAGWFLETWSKPTTVRLSLFDDILLAKGEPPANQKMTIRDAEKALWRALEEGQLVAEGMDATGKPVDIPEREWPYLRLFEERERDALKYHALDRYERYTRVHLKRSDLLRLWPEPRSTIKAEHDCYEWLVPQMRESPDRKPQSRKRFWSDAKRKFPGLAQRQFGRAWERAIRKSGAIRWSRAGRVPTKSNRRTK